MTRGIEKILDKCMPGTKIRKKEILLLLDSTLDKVSAELIRSRARKNATLISKVGRIWAAIGLDYRPCDKNCGFCSFGSKWGIIKNSYDLGLEEIVSRTRYVADNGASWIVLRTTQDYPVEYLSKIGKLVRNQIPFNVKLIANTGELTGTDLDTLERAGFYGIYHAFRLREGRDTGIAPEARIATLRNIDKSALKLVSLVEPVGIEHTNDEIAEEMLRIRHFKASLTGIMARVAVHGTPLGNFPPITEDRLANLVAVSRLVFPEVTDICVHPPSELALNSGANVIVVENGAVPRAEAFQSDWQGFDMKKADELLARCWNQNMYENTRQFERTSI